MTFADKLQSLRKTQKLSQEDLAEKCGVTRQSVSKWETGLGYPETEKLPILCDVLNVNLDYLLRDINDTPHEDKMQEHLFSFGSYIGKWLQIFLKDKEFNGFYCVGLISIQNTQLLVISIYNEVVIAQDMKGNKHTIQMSDGLFIKECQ
jgi:transcriptional regulator with XRE-family HTH domain